MSSLPARTALASAIALTGAVSVHANEPIALQDVVVSAAGFEQKVTNAPASISVISQQDLQQKRYSNLAQALDTADDVEELTYRPERHISHHCPCNGVVQRREYAEIVRNQTEPKGWKCNRIWEQHDL